MLPAAANRPLLGAWLNVELRHVAGQADSLVDVRALGLVQDASGRARTPRRLAINVIGCSDRMDQCRPGTCARIALAIAA